MSDTCHYQTWHCHMWLDSIIVSCLVSVNVITF
jgi:hypothetical protein